MRQSLAIASLAAALFAPHLRAADPPPSGTPTQPEFKLKSARDAAQTFAGTAAAAEREYRDKVAAARQKYVAALAASQAEATKAGDLDEAVRIRDAAARARKEVAAGAAAPPARAPLLADRDRFARLLPGTVWKQEGWTFQFLADGTVAAAGPRKEAWQWTAVSGDSVIVRYPTGWHNVFVFDADLKTFTMIEFGNGTTRKNSGKRDGAF